MLDADWFVFHPPTTETSPRYTAVRKAEERTRGAVTDILRTKYTPETRAEVHRRVNEVCHDYALVIDQEAPDSADKTVAIRTVRSLRMLVNEYLVQGKLDLAAAVRMDNLIVEARMWANAAIAIHYAKQARKDAERVAAEARGLLGMRPKSPGEATPAPQENDRGSLLADFLPPGLSPEAAPETTDGTQKAPDDKGGA